MPEFTKIARSLISFTAVVGNPVQLLEWILNIYQGRRIEYLPPYSPDYSPIEPAFSTIKAHIRRAGIYAHPTSQAYYEMYDAATIITPEMTWGFFHHCGYL